MKYKYILILTCLVSVYANAESGVTPGTYISLDGKYIHIFGPNNDYRGFVKQYDKKNYKNFNVKGVYEQGEGVCKLPVKQPASPPAINKKSSTSDSDLPAANVKLYIGEVQCCLEFKAISDKLAVTSITVQGKGDEVALCNNQVIKKDNNKTKY